MPFLKMLRKIGARFFSKSVLPERFWYCCCVTCSSLRKILKLYALVYIKRNRFIVCVAWNWLSSGKLWIAKRWKWVFKTNLAMKSCLFLMSVAKTQSSSPSPFALTNLTMELIICVWLCPNIAIGWHVSMDVCFILLVFYFSCCFYSFLFLFFKKMIRFITFKKSRHSLIGIA